MEERKIKKQKKYVCERRHETIKQTEPVQIHKITYILPINKIFLHVLHTVNLYRAMPALAIFSFI